MPDQERYADLEEPTFGTILCDGDFGFDGSRRLYIYAPRSAEDRTPWNTTYRLSSAGKESRFPSVDVWQRAKNQNDDCVIIYDPRVDFE